jgi:peptide/nickel transport system substrate-binding protein
LFVLRRGVTFSDGTPFSAADVAYTLRALLDPNLHSPTGDPFRAGGGTVEVAALAEDRIRITFPQPVAGLLRLFDQAPILSARSPQRERAVLGPFVVAEYKPGVHVLLRRNPHYWKRDTEGRRLPYLDAIRLEIQQNREIELLRFRRGELHLINSLDPELYERLASNQRDWVRDAGPSPDSEQLWFNQVAAAPIAAHKKAWFRSKAFRRAVSEAIHREDVCRLVYRGHARAAFGPVSPVDRAWFHHGLRPPRFDPQRSAGLLAQAGFRLSEGALQDRAGNLVEFSVITNSGNRNRERMAAMIQQDLKRLGMRINVVTLDFPSLLERITRSFDYEACLLGLVNIDPDPNSQMNVWLSSAANHQWNPSQKSPETPWEAEIDKLMLAQASTVDDRRRKALFDRVQEIVAEELPFLYLINRNALCAVSPSLRNVAPAVLRPQTYWNAEQLRLVSN